MEVLQVQKMKYGIKTTESEARAKGYVTCKRCY